ncbi:MAG: hypothetical protein ACFHVJ_09865 [Aestuariibacter sp.]
MKSFFKSKLLAIFAPILIIGIFVGFFWLTSLLLQMNTDITYVVLFILIILLQVDWGGLVKKFRNISKGAS